MSFMRVLKFFNLIDSNGSLSISNLSVYCVLIKILTTSCLSPEDIGAFLISLGNYVHKRSINNPIVKIS